MVDQYIILPSFMYDGCYILFTPAGFEILFSITKSGEIASNSRRVLSYWDKDFIKTNLNLNVKK